jgi:pyruvyl transferase EpsO
LKFLDKLSELQEIFTAALESHLSGHEEYSLFDFPDHANVGDSLIFQGEMKFLSDTGLSATSVHSISSPLATVEAHADLVIFHGGGNLGGLYPVFDQYRQLILSYLRKDTKVIVMPQSVARHRSDNLAVYKDFGTQLDIIFFARDSKSQEILSSEGLTAILAPDAAHMLGQIQAPPAIQDFICLARTDKEAEEVSPPARSVDWLSESLLEKTGQTIRDLGKFSDRFGRLLGQDMDKFQTLAARRVERGISLLSVGQTIFTDRLHAMILGLQLGRRVVAVDNNNKKLSRYIDTWGLNQCEELSLVSKFSAR